MYYYHYFLPNSSLFCVLHIYLHILIWALICSCMCAHIHSTIIFEHTWNIKYQSFRFSCERGIDICRKVPCDVVSEDWVLCSVVSVYWGERLHTFSLKSLPLCTLSIALFCRQHTKTFPRQISKSLEHVQVLLWFFIFSYYQLKASFLFHIWRLLTHPLNMKGER
jgi:hypothetical protein